MYHRTQETTAGKALSPGEKRKFLSMDTLLDLTEAIATLTMGAGFLLLVAACLAALSH